MRGLLRPGANMPSGGSAAGTVVWDCCRPVQLHTRAAAHRGLSLEHMQRCVADPRGLPAVPSCLVVVQVVFCNAGYVLTGFFDTV